MAGERLPRRNAIPILYTRGTHYEVGFDVGRTFGSIINGFLDIYSPLLSSYLYLYNTPTGRQVYNETLASVQKSFPQYVRELEGIADGAKVEFYKLFLLNMDDILPVSLGNENHIEKEPVGCSTILINKPDCQILGHTEDALSETLNHFYFVDAHILSDTPQGKHKVVEEHFVSLCYAGCLPGYTMSYNHHGLVFSINTISAKELRSGKTPRTFITRALLAAENYEQAEDILKDRGVGAADGCTINMCFIQNNCDSLNFYNIEMGPVPKDADESLLDIKVVPLHQCNYHCNKYLRLQLNEINELMLESSVNRMKAFFSFSTPETEKELIQMLGDTSTKPHTVFREDNDPNQAVKTIAVGIFNLRNKTITLYSDNPKYNSPLVVLPMYLKESNVSQQ